MKIYFQIIWTFIKVGALTFGGGYAMLPVLQREVIEKRGWLTNEEAMDYYAVCQVMPGMIMVNTSAFIGRKLKGSFGAFLAAVSSSVPSLLIIVVIASVLSGFSDTDAVKNAFAGVRVCVIVLIINSLEKLWKNSVVDWKTLLICVGVFSASVFTKLSPVVFVISAAVLGIFIMSAGGEKE